MSMNSTPPNARRRSAPSNAPRPAGKLITNIGKTFPLADIVAAHEAVEAGNVLGNVVVQIG